MSQMPCLCFFFRTEQRKLPSSGSQVRQVVLLVFSACLRFVSLNTMDVDTCMNVSAFLSQIYIQLGKWQVLNDIERKPFGYSGIVGYSRYSTASKKTSWSRYDFTQFDSWIWWNPASNFQNGFPVEWSVGPVPTIRRMARFCGWVATLGNIVMQGYPSNPGWCHPAQKQVSCDQNPRSI